MRSLVLFVSIVICTTGAYQVNLYIDASCSSVTWSSRYSMDTCVSLAPGSSWRRSVVNDSFILESWHNSNCSGRSNRENVTVDRCYQDSYGNSNMVTREYPRSLTVDDIVYYSYGGSNCTSIQDITVRFNGNCQRYIPLENRGICSIKNEQYQWVIMMGEDLMLRLESHIVAPTPPL